MGNLAADIKRKLKWVLFIDNAGILSDKILRKNLKIGGLVRLPETRWIHKIKFISMEWSGIDIFKMPFSSNRKIHQRLAIVMTV